ncbi:MAG: DUF1800 domain-containing protein [Rhizobiales bacterium]|nr:DUF1800 domain-containing protein [Hyphomicrobiales bacterium]NRB14422.1 DUF1800 domain-containing protein [Hyphomicrobiales bacterium]
MTFNNAQIACHRFGLGARPDEIMLATQMGGQLFLQSQLAHYQVQPEPIASLPTSAELMAEAATIKLSLRQTTNKNAKQNINKTARKQAQAVYLQAIDIRHKLAISSQQSFNERLVYFWQNHFAVSAQKQSVRFLAASFENEAIRQNVMGRFADMLIASTQHPAMQLYLDNFRSIGPDSKLGKKQNKGLNENLAREILELHTLGVQGGYEQKDVIAFANMLTGWGVDYQTVRGFRFNKNAHQGQPAEFLGKNYSQKGMRQALAGLNHLAVHASTAKHIATKLAQHFAGTHNQQLTKSLVDELETSFNHTQGQLKPLYEILINHGACWQAAPLRFRTPYEWIIALLRAAGNVKIPANAMLNLLKNMGQQTYFVSSPAGWPDEDNYWNSPAAMIQKWQNSKRFSQIVNKNVTQYVQNILGENIDQHTLLAMQKAGKKNTQLTMLFLSEQLQFR